MSKNANVMMYWALDENRELKTIEEVKNGKSCNCTCAGCGAEVWARNGGDPDIRAHHFAHAPKKGDGCSGEGALHYAAKHFLKEELDSGRSLNLPATLSHLSKRKLGIFIKDKELLNFTAIESEVEKTLSRNLRADCWAKNDVNFDLALEVFVTNKKSSEDIKKFKDLNQKAIEINLSKLDWDSSKARIVEELFSTRNLKWLYFHDFKKYEAEAYEKEKAKRQKDLDEFLAEIKDSKKEESEKVRYVGSRGDSQKVQKFDIAAKALMNKINGSLPLLLEAITPKFPCEIEPKKIYVTDFISNWEYINGCWGIWCRFNNTNSHGKIVISSQYRLQEKVRNPTYIFSWHNKKIWCRRFEGIDYWRAVLYKRCMEENRDFRSTN